MTPLPTPPPRNPLLHFSHALVRHVIDDHGASPLLVLNKCDLVPPGVTGCVLPLSLTQINMILKGRPFPPLSAPPSLSLQIEAVLAWCSFLPSSSLSSPLSLPPSPPCRGGTGLVLLLRGPLPRPQSGGSQHTRHDDAL